MKMHLWVHFSGPLRSLKLSPTILTIQNGGGFEPSAAQYFPSPKEWDLKRPRGTCCGWKAALAVPCRRGWPSRKRSCKRGLKRQSLQRKVPFESIWIHLTWSRFADFAVRLTKGGWARADFGEFWRYSWWRNSSSIHEMTVKTFAKIIRTDQWTLPRSEICIPTFSVTRWPEGLLCLLLVPKCWPTSSAKPLKDQNDVQHTASKELKSENFNKISKIIIKMMAQLKFTLDYGPMANCGSQMLQMLHSGSASVAMAMAASVAEAPRSLRPPRASMPLKLSSAKVGRPRSSAHDEG